MAIQQDGKIDPPFQGGISLIHPIPRIASAAADSILGYFRSHPTGEECCLIGITGRAILVHSNGSEKPPNRHRRQMEFSTTMKELLQLLWGAGFVRGLSSVQK